MSTFKSTLLRAAQVKAVTDKYYEAGNQARCYKAVWRHWIEPQFGICYDTYLKLIGISRNQAEAESKSAHKPLPLFPDL